MVEPLRHRQTKEAATDMFSLQQLRHISTLPISTEIGCPLNLRFARKRKYRCAVLSDAPGH